MITTKRIAFLFLLVAASLTWPGNTLASDPAFSAIYPRGGQRGTEVVLNLHGDRLDDVQKVMLYDKGLTVKKLEKVSPKHIKATVAIAADAPLGEQRIRLHARSGISYMRTFWVGQFPTVEEKEPNNDFEAPQALPGLNVTVAGIARNEDIDYYVVKARKGQRITAEIEGIRLGLTLLDPYVAILNEERFELSTSDDTALLLQDSVASVIAPKDGKYIIVARDSSYAGNDNARYRLHIGTFPRPMVVYPAGGQVNQDLDVRLIGDAAGDIQRKIKLPTEATSRHLIHTEDQGLSTPSPNTLRVSTFPNFLEIEPNNSLKQASTTTAPLPIAFNGIIQEAKDIDWFRFTAKKGQRFLFKAHARRLRSPLDAVLNVRDKTGKNIKGSDDANNYPDSVVDFTAPADGEYTLTISDHLKRGGPQFVYRIETEPIARSLSVSIPRFQRNDSQQRQVVPVPRGNRFATMISIVRTNFGGDIAFDAPDLATGVTLNADTMPGNITSFPVVFSASNEAALDAKLAQFNAKFTDPKNPNNNVAGSFTQSVDFVLGNPNNTVYYGATGQNLPIAVVEEIPFTIDLETPAIPLVQNGSMNLKVKINRKPGFESAVTVRMLWNPPGVGSAGTISIPKGKSEGFYPINANGGAEVRTWKIAVLGESNAGQGAIYASSDLTNLIISPPYVNMKIQMATVEVGKESNVICKLDQKIAFEGKAIVKLLGLPAKVTTGDMEITKGDKEVVFPVKTDPKSPKGKHKQLFCQILVPEEGHQIAHNVGHGGTLRIDPPPPAPKKPATPNAEAIKKEEVAKAVPPAKKPEKPLSRLEQLRLKSKK